MGDTWRLWLHEATNLVLRADCVCCGGVNDGDVRLARHQLCESCELELMKPWERWNAPALSGVGIGVYVAGAYGGARRALVLSAKERLRPAAWHTGGRVFRQGLMHVASRGVVHDPRLARLAVIPAPTRPSSAKKREGDVVARMAHEAVKPWPAARVFAVAQLHDAAPDSVGLSKQQRKLNVARHLRVDAAAAQAVARYIQPGGSVVIIDDVCTTGATVGQLCIALRGHGVKVAAILAIAGV